MTTTHVRTARAVLTAAASVAVAGTLAACGSEAPAETTPAETGDASATAEGSETSEDVASADPGTASADPGTGSAAASADGTYTASGSYVSPGGRQEVEVTLTLAADVVTDVDVAVGAVDPQSELFQGKFASGIADVVVGVPLDELAVDKVAGSSLTSGGFNEAVEAIRAQALTG